MRYLILIMIFFIFNFSKSLSDSQIQAIALSDQKINKIKQFGDSIWAVGRGISFFDKSKNQLVRLHQDNLNLVSTDFLFTDICRDNQNNFYFSSNQGIWILNNDGKWEFIKSDSSPLPSDSVNCVNFDKNGTLWIGTEKGFIRKTGQFWDLENYGIKEPVKSITFDPNSDTTFICNGLHFFYTLAYGNLTPIYFPIVPLIENSVVSYKKVIKDKYGTKYIATSGTFGLVIWNGDQVEQVLTDSYSESYISDIEEDAYGNIIGINGSGFFKYDINGLLLSEKDYNLDLNSTGKAICVGSDTDGSIWFGGSCPFSHRRIVNNTPIYKRYNHCLMPGPLLNYFYSRRNGEVFLSNYKGLGFFDNHTLNFFDSTDYSSKISGITDISIDSQNRIFAVSQNKFYTFDKISLQEVLTQKNKPYPIYGSECDTEDNLWLSSLKNLWRLFNNQLDSFPIPGTANNFCFSDIKIDKNNTKWIKTIEGFYGFKDGKWIDSIVSANVPIKIRAFEDLKMFIDFDGNIWFSSISDIFQYDNKNWSVFSAGKNGVPDFKSLLDKIPTLSFNANGKMYLNVDEKVYSKEGKTWKYMNDIYPNYQKSYKFFVDANDNKWVYNDDPDSIELILFKEKNIITSINENDFKSEKQIDIYPNPAKDNIKINGIFNKSYEIFDIYGKKIDSGQYADKLDITKLPIGIYLIKLEGIENPKKFVKY